MQERVCAVVVTYNRKGLLRPCLRSVLAQTRPVDQVVVIDNKSTDGSRDMLAEEFPDIPVVALASNLGGAGGFHEGMKWAYERGFEWIWVMDDDVRVLPEALDKLLSYSGEGDLIQGRKLINGEPLIWEALWDTGACMPVTFERDISFENGKRWTTMIGANFEGALLRRSVIDKVGLPDIRYFIAGDDSMYGLKASFHTRVIYVEDIVLEKDLALNGPKSRLTYYFPLRNRFLNFEHLRGLGLPVSRKMLMLQTAVSVASQIREIAATPKDRSWRNVKTVIQAFRDGLAGRFGKPQWI